MLRKMCSKIMFDGETGLEHYIIPGGYKMTFGNRTVRLGFKAHSGVFRIDKNNRKVLSFEQEWLDTEHCPDAASVTADDVRDLKRIVSFSANVDESGNEVNPIRIMSLSFEFDGGTVVDCTNTDAVKDFMFDNVFIDKCYEAYKLNWMLSHGWTLRDISEIFRGLAAEEVEEEPMSIPTDESSVNNLADCLEERFWTESGFGHGAMYACRDEFLETEFVEEQYMTDLLSMMPETEKMMKKWREITGLTTPELDRIITLSTAHITEGTAKLLDSDIGEELSGIVSYPKIGLPLNVIMGSGKEEVERESYGWWIFIPRDEDLREMKHLPDDLRACIGYAKGYGCRWLCLDRDGSTTDALPEYDW